MQDKKGENCGSKFSETNARNYKYNFKIILENDYSFSIKRHVHNR